jgi:hypothetical protein
MIAGEDQQMRLREAGRQRLLDFADLQRQLFELTERTQRFRFRIDACLQTRQWLERTDAEGHGWVFRL